MPPFGFRKRERTSSPLPTPPSKRKATSTSTPKRGKPTLFETADEPSKARTSLQENKTFLQQLDGDDESSLSDAESDEFEDVPPTKRRKTSPDKGEQDGEEEEEEEEEEMDWEDAIQHASSSHAPPTTSKPGEEIGDVSISMTEDGAYIQPLVSAATGKKGPSKRERQIRVQTHCLHVQALMWHNTIRNSWLNDKEVQKTLVDGLTDGVRREVQSWKEAMGTLSKEELEAKKKATAAKGKGKRGKKGKEKSSGRDWNYEAEHLETGMPNLSGGDPLLRLLKVLTAYWRKRFTSTAPAMRKQGYKPLRRLRDEIKAWEKDQKDVEEHGERVESLQAFRKLAKNCEGSRDVGAQLFVALLRGLGLETRMVANLQPVGFGWSKAEEADPKKTKKKGMQPERVESESESEDEVKVKAAPPKSSGSAKRVKSASKDEKPTRRSSRGNKADPINLDDSDSSLSSPPSESEHAIEVDDEDDDDLSIIDITPPTPKKKPNKHYNRDVAFPNYWTEVCSPVSHRWYPIDPIVLSTIASTDDLLQTFEPRGKKAEKAKQVICYSIAFASDGTAKDVTVRYLKRHQLPGKTKGMRIPVEKVPVYNRKGKVKRYEEYEWFRTLMSLYDRPELQRTPADDLEEQTDLKVFKPATESKVVEKESLQGYKQSADFVLELHLRREEALLPGAEPVKSFTAGKGDKAVEHPVYRRGNVVVCKTVESWHKEGRAIQVGEQPMKYVPMRAVTLIRKREIEDAQRETGEKLKQGLYAQAQTDWIIPPPIQDGVIPKNAFGNMDVYVPTMVPRGAVHLPLKGSAKLCRRLEIDYAEACTGFEFGKQRAVPVLTGVVVAKGNEMLVRDAWRTEQAEVRRKEDTKRTAAALHWWRKMLLGLRVLDRMKREYADAGGTEEEVNPFVAKARREGRFGEGDGDAGLEERMEGRGGFFPDAYDEEEVLQRNSHTLADEHGDAGTGGFLMEDKIVPILEGGVGFLVEDDNAEDIARVPSENHTPITPVSLQSLHKTMDGTADSEPEEELEGPQSTKVTRKSSAPFDRKPRQGKANGALKTANGRRSKSKTFAVECEDEVEESPLSDLSSESAHASNSEEESDEDSDSVSTPPLPTTVKKSNDMRSSPQVVVTPISSARGQAGSRRAVKKRTPVKSQYFNHSDDEDEETDTEVVQPRKTTARTKGRF